jgi:hypothetical protein
MMRRYENAIRANMASAETDLKSAEDKGGFVTGAVLKLWELYSRDKQIDESQFDRLIGVLSSFSGAEYRGFIQKQVAAYKSGNPPTIIGY